MNFRILARLCLAALVAVALPACQAAPPSWAKVPNYQALYVFGDSLSDTGNDLIVTRAKSFYPPVPPSESPHRTYYQGRFSNGPVAFEYLWRLVARPGDAALYPSLASEDFSKKSAVSFAFGGSGSEGVTSGPGGFDVPGVLAQVAMFGESLHGKKANKQALYAIWSGANDYIFGGLVNLSAVVVDSSAVVVDPNVVVGHLATAIESLYSLGARSFLVPNLPDMGLSPFLQAQGKGPMASQLTRAHNAALSQALDGLAARLSGIQIVRVDVYALTNKLVSERIVQAGPPALALIAPGTGAVDCLFRDPMTCPDVEVSAKIPALLFWDALHPTTQVHELVAEEMYKQLAK